jgi:hypothetical protein
MNQFIVDVAKERWWYFATIPVGITGAGIGSSSLSRHAER